MCKYQIHIIDTVKVKRNQLKLALFLITITMREINLSACATLYGSRICAINLTQTYQHWISNPRKSMETNV